MSKTAFDTFVSEQKRLAGAKEADWPQRRAEWLLNLQSLYDKIESILSSYISAGDIRVRYDPIELNEEGLGIYSASRLVLTIGTQDIVFAPVGTLIFGAKGRVDVLGSRGRATFLFADRTVKRVSQHGILRDRRANPDWSWMIAPALPASTLIDLTSESLKEAILEITNA